MAIQQKPERLAGQFTRQELKPKAIKSSKFGIVNYSSYGLYKSNGIILHSKGAN